MKNKLPFTLIIALLLFVNNTLSQGFETNIKFNEFSNPHCICETKNGYIAAICDYNFTEYYKRSANLVLINNLGENVLHRKFENYYTQTITNLKIFGDTSIVAIGYESPHIDSLYNIVSYKLDINFNTIKKHVIKTHIPVKSYMRTSLYVTSDNNLVFQLAHKAFEDTVKGFYFAQFSPDGDILKTNNFYYKVPYSALITTNQNGGYFVFCESDRFTFDADFKHVETLYFPFFSNTDNLRGITDAIWENDSTLLLAKNRIANSNLLYSGLARLKKGGTNVINDTVYEFADEPLEWRAMYRGLDTVANYIYLATTPNSPGSSEFFDDITTGIRVMKINKDFSIKWSKYFENHADNFVTYLSSTSDGGCIVTSARYDFSLPEKYYSAYIAKLDSNGNTRPLSKINQTVNNSFSLYPNPGNGHVTVNMPAEFNNAVITFYNIAGVVQHSQTINNTNPVINVTNLPAGLYIYTITNNGIVARQGKWVKN